MNDSTRIVAENFARVQQRVASAAAAAGRVPEEITLVAVTKYVDAATTAMLLAAGCHDLGESRPQSLWDKAESADLAEARWHLVGHLQRNKVRRTLPYITLIHSVDSTRLLTAINDQATELNRSVGVLLEVNTSGDTAKHGLSADELPALIETLPKYPNVQVRGLMTMAARQGGLDIARKNFSALRELRDSLAKYCPQDSELSELSMGMSGDFEAAIAEGATIVRVGSALFEGLA